MDFLSMNEDGSANYTAHMPEGESVRFAYANIRLINPNIERLFIYSCMSRKLVLKDKVGLETEPLQKIAPTAGFYTWGIGRSTSVIPTTSS